MNRPLVTKDLLAVWKLAASLSLANLTVSAWAVRDGGTQSPHLWTVAGVLVTFLAAGAAMIPATLIGYERERRHLILLQTLPVTARRILWSKFSVSVVTSLTVALLGAVPWLLAGHLNQDFLLLPVPALLGLSAASVLVTVVTRQPTALMGLLALGYGLLGASGFAVFSLGLDPLPLAAAAVLPAGAAAAILVESAARVMARKELEL